MEVHTIATIGCEWKEAEKMRTLYLVGFLFLFGCQGTVGPFDSRKPERVDDPLLSIGEQQRRGRDRLALPDDTGVVPSTGLLNPGPHDYR
jgi:hypothetical protein